MKRYLLSSVAALMIAGQVHAQSAADIEAAVDTGIVQLNESGANLTFGTKEIVDGGLLLRDVRMAPDDGEVVIEAEFIRMEPSTDAAGDVVVTVSPVVTLTATPTDGTAPMQVEMQSEGFELVTNWLLQPAGQHTLALRADSLAVTGGSPDHPVLKRLDVRPKDLDVRVAFDEETRNLDAALSLSSVLADYAITDPTTGHTSEVTTNSGGQTVTLTATALPEDEEGLESFADDGGAFQLLIEGSGGTTSFSTTDPNMAVAIDASGESGSAEISLIEGSFLYKFDFGALEYVLTPNPDVLPLPPFNASMAGGAMEFRMPVTASDESRDLTLSLALRELVLGDTVWAMIDPGATIPRDPATLEIDVAAKAVLSTPLAEAAGVENPMDIGQVDSIDVNRLFLSAGGAVINAVGGVTMDNSGPIPMPNGAIDVSVAGLQGLAQKLVEIGLVDQMQVGMMMGMMMAFATPGDAPDSYNSKIEFRDGGIFANGQPLQ